MARGQNGLRPARWLVLLAVAIVVSGIAPFVPVTRAEAAQSFTVTTTDDFDDGACTTSNCTLREAINAANANDSGSIADYLRFGIDGNIVHRFTPTTALPTISEPLVIDGYSQPGSKENSAARGTNAVLRIVLDGGSGGRNYPGLSVRAPNTTIRGLVIVGFDVGISIITLPDSENANNAVEGCFIGSGMEDLVSAPNNFGIDIGDAGVRIGGNDLADRNLVSGNRIANIRLRGAIIDPEPVVRIEGNLIGPDRTGTRREGQRSAFGVLILDGNSLIVRNIIAYNNEAGVTIGEAAGASGASGNQVIRNSIYANGEASDALGIDLFPEGATGNDPGDGDIGPNGLQNHPELDSALTSKAKKRTTIKGKLDSQPGREYRLQFFANPKNDPAEGRTYLGEKVVETGASGTALISFVRRTPVPAGQFITATATDLETGDTSEFSPPVVVKKGR